MDEQVIQVHFNSSHQNLKVAVLVVGRETCQIQKQTWPQTCRSDDYELWFRFEVKIRKVKANGKLHNVKNKQEGHKQRGIIVKAVYKL